MIFAAPWVLAALVVLPALWWLLRASPPAPRAQAFPAIRLLAGLRAREETPARTPLWLLLLRLAAAALVIVGLARPVLTGGRMAVAGGGTALLVVDDGWAAGPNFAARVQAAGAILDRLDRAGRRAQVLTTAPGEDGLPPQASAVMQAGLLRPLVDALRPKPWPVDRSRVAAAIVGEGPSYYISDGLAGPQDAAFVRALAARGPLTVLTGAAPARLLSAEATPEHLVARLRQVPWPTAREESVLAETSDGRVLTRTRLVVPAGAGAGRAELSLPQELRNQLGALRLAAAPGAGAVALLDEASRRRPVGLAGGDVATDAPLLGEQYYLERALGQATELRHGTIAALLSRKLSMLVLTASSVSPDDQAAILAWVRQGGLLLRFASAGLAPAPDAGPSAAAPGGDAPGGDASASAAPAADPLLPGRLLPGDRQLGGAMSWSRPAHLAAFPDGSPFAGLRVPAEVTVSRQVLADPSEQPAPAVWASLTDGTPLVTAARRGAGEVVLCHVTANADWSNLVLSGLFVDMLGRLVARSAGVAAADDARLLAPALLLDGQGVLGTLDGKGVLGTLDGKGVLGTLDGKGVLGTLDGKGVLGTLAPAARGVRASEIGRIVASPAHPPGFYGAEQDRHALNLGAAPIGLAAMAAIPGASVLSLTAAPRERPVGPWLVAAAVALLCADVLLTLWLRGLLAGISGRGWRRAGAAAALAGLLAGPAQAAGPASTADSPALATHLAYVVTGDAQVDAISRAGLAGLSDYVNSRTAAVLAEPAGVVPGHDDLGFFPLLYLPVTAQTDNSPRMVAALNDYMRHGGIVVIDLRGGDAEAAGSGAGAAPDTAAALRRLGAGLRVPRLAPLTSAHVLARAFYLLSDFPGRFDGDTVWVGQDQDRSNDSVSPVIVGSNDWAAAWAVDEDGNALFATVPGGARQRTLAFRFGVNLVMYALTGNYKGDQVHVPAILERLGQ